MIRSRFTEIQIVNILKEHLAGQTVARARFTPKYGVLSQGGVVTQSEVRMISVSLLYNQY